METNIIETNRLLLRHWKETDAYDLFMYASDPDIGTAAGWPPHTSINMSRETIHTVFSAPEIYAMILKETGYAVGCCGMTTCDKRRNRFITANDAEIGYWIGKPYWGQGLTTEAVKAIIKRGFETLRLNTLWIAFFEGNRRSERIARKCGFDYHHTVVPELSNNEFGRKEHFMILKSEV